LRPGDPILTVEIAAADIVLASRVLVTEARDVARIEFTLPHEADADNPRLEFRFSHHANASLEIRDVQLSAATPATRKRNRLGPPALARLPQSMRLFHRAADRA